MRALLKTLTSIHIPSSASDVFIFAAPRSGSTLIHDLILTQPGFKPCTPTFDLRNELVARHLAKVGIKSWADLYSDQATDGIATYIRGISKGDIRINDPIFFRNHFRVITRRIAFKVLDACEDRIPWFKNTFNGGIVYLTRHPIPVALSRKQTPRLEVLVTSDYKRHFTEAQLGFARKVIDSGTDHERGVLDWCLQNSVPLRQAGDGWACVSYEQLVLDPRPLVEALCARLALPDPGRMLERCTTPASSSESSDKKTKEILERRAQARNDGEGQKLNQWLVEKWREKVDETEERRLMEILDVFEIDVYRRGTSLPADRFWVRSPGAA